MLPIIIKFLGILFIIGLVIFTIWLDSHPKVETAVKIILSIVFGALIIGAVIAAIIIS